MTDREAMKLALDALQEALKIDSLKDSRKFELVTAPKAMAALRHALAEPDMGIDRGAWADVPDATKWVDELRGGDETEEEEPVACKHNRYSVDVHEQTGTCYDCGAEGRMRFVVDDTAPPKQPEHEPYCYHDGRNIVGKEYADHSDVFPLYTAPPKREWVGLTETERINLEILMIGQIQVTGLNVKGISNAIRAVEQVLKEKNHD